MKDFKVAVKKLTDEELMREACESTFLGKSHQTLASIYRSEHSPARTQIFWIKCENIPLFVSTHIIRHHVGSQPYQLTCRDDREGGNPGVIGKINDLLHRLTDMRLAIQNKLEYDILGTIDYVMERLRWLQDNSDRYTPVNLSILVNAQSLIDMAKLRMCNQASMETRIVFNEIRRNVEMIDPDLAHMMVPKCVYCGGICHEPKCCGFNTTEKFKLELAEYMCHMGGAKRCSPELMTALEDALKIAGNLALNGHWDIRQKQQSF